MVEIVDFHRTKYGPEILVDAAWVREMPTFLRHGPHALTFYDILLVTRGRGWYSLDAHRYPVRPGMVFFTSPGEVRGWDVRDLDGLCFFFPALFLEEFFHDPLFLHRLPCFHAPAGQAALRLPEAKAAGLRRLLLAMRRELQQLRPDSAHLLRARLYEALVTLGRAHAAAHGGAAERSPNGVTLRFRELVERDAVRRHHAADYARELGVSAGHLSVLSRRYLGRNAKGVITDRLVLEARRRLLYSDDTAAQVAHALGFRDPSYFTRFFRREAGRSPSAFRAEHRLAHH
jgi:AraC family transcriptional regulator, transcriptional activator of pobA